jgi:myo-inositol 2-dehydrogenase / D-chiro-inositol 1-dehydrogenase
VHNLDRASWVMHDTAPVKCHGMGGRSTLKGEIYGSVFDHHAITYEFANGVRIYAACRTIPECYNENSSVLLAPKAAASSCRAASKEKLSGPTPVRALIQAPRVID